MKIASLLITGSLVVFGQTTSTTGTTDRNTQSGQRLTGVLMDASCQAIASRGAGSGTAMRTWSGADSNGARSSTGTGATSGGDSASAQGTTGSGTQSAGASGTGGNKASATEGAGRSDTVTQAGRQSSTAGVHDQTGATSGSTSASAQGTTGTATASSGDRNRSAGDAVPTTVREKYRDCMATANTTSFALHADGKLYVLDQAGNDMIRQQMSGEAFRGSMANADGSPQWMTVTVQGTPNGDNLTITSVRR